MCTVQCDNVISFYCADLSLPSLQEGEVCQGRKVMQGLMSRGPRGSKDSQVPLYESFVSVTVI